MRKNTTFIIIFVFATLFAQNELQHEETIYSVLWQKTSAEYRALAYQAYNLATLRLKSALTEEHEKPLAIIADLDETVLDNSQFEALSILEGLNFYDDFMQWVDEEGSTSVPGAFEFLKFASENDVEIFYISNRDEKFREGTLKNLQKLDFPYTDNDHILLRNGDSNKQYRRDLVSKKFEIVLLLGDNLIDFLDVFRKKSIEQRYASVDSLQAEFGDKFIVLPNPMYGEWEKTIYGGTRKISDEKKEAFRLEALQKKD
ncbi:MAG: 5'-nucleotidase, lipoprotein e(P4) family [Candidatus Cloacimonadota bacterium]|nr:MAG: 5'-nucleotidase, lipoprotein e(P4) family [Candidatus Cloacimonadota bacterium]